MFAHGPGFDSPDVDGVRVMVRLRNGVRVRLGVGLTLKLSTDVSCFDTVPSELSKCQIGVAEPRM